jgi:hypothetical protein
MSEFNFSVWETTLKCHFHTHKKCKISPHVIFNLITNLEAINSGLKPGYLWDIKEITVEHTQLVNLVADLRRNRLLHPGIFVVSIGEELLVADLRRVYFSCSSYLNVCFVDVSSQLDAPCMVQNGTDVASDIKCMLTDVGKRIAEFICIESDNNKLSEFENGCNLEAVKYKPFSEPYINLRCKSEDKRSARNTSILHMSEIKIGNLCLSDEEHREVGCKLDYLKGSGPPITQTDVTETHVDPVLGLKGESKMYFDLTPEKNWCVPTLLGVFLGYPVIYWYKATSERNEGETCLSLVPLTVFKIKVEIRTGYHRQNRCYDLYSFSVPRDVLLHLEQEVHRWFKNLLVVIKSQKGIFKNMVLMNETVMLASVVL